VKGSVEFSQGRSERVNRQLSGMSGSCRQSPDSRYNLAFADPCGLLGLLPFRQLGHSGSTCHGGYAAFRTKTDLGDAARVHFDCQLEDIAACRVLNPHVGICARKLTGVARVFEVVEKLRRIHGGGSTSLAYRACRILALV